MRRWTVVVGVLLASGAPAALQLTLDRRAIEEAVFIGRSRLDAERRRFHQTYRLVVNEPPVDWIDVITPFHRVALAAGRTARRGTGPFGQIEAMQILRESPNQVDVLVEMTFHPLNTFVGMPAYDVALVGPDEARMRPRHVDRFPRSGPRMTADGPVLPELQAGGRGDGPVLGGTVVAAFDGTILDPSGRYRIVVMDGDQTIASRPIDFAAFR